MFKKERRDRDDEGIPVRWARRAFKDLKEFDVVKVDGIVGVVQKVWENAVDMIRVTDDAGLENCVYARFNKFLVATVPRKRKR